MAEKFLLKNTKVKVIGIGGGGGSIVSELAKRIKKASFLVANTDSQALKKVSKNVHKFQFGEEITHGLGTGADIKLGELAAQKEKQKIKRVLQNQDFCIFVSCLGGGTGSGATPVFTEVAKESKSINLGIFTFPFKFEGERKMETAREALEKIKPNLNGFLIIHNQKIFKIIDKNTALDKAFESLNKILSENLSALISLIFEPGLINIDFADFKAILDGSGEKIYFNTAQATGINRDEEIVKKIFNSSIVDFNIISGKRILFNISGGKNLKMIEAEKICNNIADLNRNSKIIFGVSQILPQNKQEIGLTVLVVGDDKKRKELKTEKIFIKKEKNNKKPEISKELPRTKEKIKKEIKIEKKPAKPKKIKKKEEKKRSSALDLKKAAQEEENKRLAEENKWDIPAFMRRSPWREKIKIFEDKKKKK
jgi:cell division protein FtsZ